MRSTVFCLLLLLTSSLSAVLCENSCRFAASTSIDRLLSDASYREQFIMNMTYWEGKFSVDGVGLNLNGGLTYDGHAIDYTTGLSHQPLHAFSAASKECIHLGLLAKAISGNSPFALNFFKSASEKETQFSSTKDYMIAMLERKISNYENFNKMYPGFGGYVSWYSINTQDQMDLLWDWTDRVPALDNGELIWSMVAAAQALEDVGQIALAKRYWDHLNLMATTSIPVFYAGNGCIRCVTKIVDVKAKPDPSNYKSDGFCCLDDPYEGELMAFFMDFYADWRNAGFSDSERDKIWSLKRGKLQKTTYNSTLGPIDVEKGWWYSSHEKWKYLMMPYTDVPINKQIYLNGERARLRFSYEQGFGGLFASVTNVSQAGNYEPGYISATGIQEIAFMKVQTNQLVTPYGAYPLLISEELRPYGLAWYAAMLKGSKMQGPYGSTESVSIDGTMISPVTTWDSKITSVLAVCGGVGDIVRVTLQKQGFYDRFVSIIHEEWSRVFPGELRGTNIPFVAPAVTIPSVLPDFTACQGQPKSRIRR